MPTWGPLPAKLHDGDDDVRGLLGGLEKEDGGLDQELHGDLVGCTRGFPN